MFVVRNIATHEVVARDLTKAEAERVAVEMINKTWDHFEAYPQRFVD